ncbi:MAG: hypothetical protein WC651_00450 [Candidatus Gracilibacteria bacterium]|jgi:hypothetical protein
MSQIDDQKPRDETQLPPETGPQPPSGQVLTIQQQIQEAQRTIRETAEEKQRKDTSTKESLIREAYEMKRGNEALGKDVRLSPNKGSGYTEELFATDSKVRNVQQRQITNHEAKQTLNTQRQEFEKIKDKMPKEQALEIEIQIEETARQLEQEDRTLKTERAEAEKEDHETKARHTSFKEAQRKGLDPVDEVLAAHEILQDDTHAYIQNHLQTPGNKEQFKREAEEEIRTQDWREEDILNLTKELSARTEPALTTIEQKFADIERRTTTMLDETEQILSSEELQAELNNLVRTIKEAQSWFSRAKTREAAQLAKRQFSEKLSTLFSNAKYVALGNLENFGRKLNPTDTTPSTIKEELNTIKQRIPQNKTIAPIPARTELETKIAEMETRLSSLETRKETLLAQTRERVSTITELLREKYQTAGIPTPEKLG